MAAAEHRAPAVLFQWASHGPYHLDRLNAVQAAGITDLQIIGAATAESNESHAWDRLSSDHIRVYHLIDRPNQRTRI